MKKIYSALTEAKALEIRNQVSEKWDEQYPRAMKSWFMNWDA
ncbi:MAG: hypothetical protein Q4D42_10395 [Eubacteriales bacterium]|nr:hypothetical protein [Eubacteriales bacterium]